MDEENRERKTPKSRGNFRVPECMKFDCVNRSDEGCDQCVPGVPALSNYEKGEPPAPSR